MRAPFLCMSLAGAFIAAPLLAQPAAPSDPPAEVVPSQRELTAGAPTTASDVAPETPQEQPLKMSTLVVYGDDPCPRSRDDEIVVCAREPESERYRVPRRFREAAPGPESEAWSNRVQTLETVSRIGTPNSCSPVGSGGATGCMQQFLRQAREERRQQQSESSGVP